MKRFIPGLELCERFYHEVVAPILASGWPRLRYSAGLLGYGSEVLGFDTPRSTDHMWGPRVLLFLGERNQATLATRIDLHLKRTLPATFLRQSVHFGKPDAVGVRLPAVHDGGPVEHIIQVHTLGSFLQRQLGMSASAKPTAADWLRFDEQSLLEVTAGRVFHHGLKGLVTIRKRYAYYPRDIWLSRLALAWQDLTDEEAFPGRCEELGDSLGRRVLLGRQAHKLMRLCFLLEKRYAPYSKWFGTAFARLRAARQLGPMLEAALTSNDWRTSEDQLIRASEFVARKHNRLGITPRLPQRASFFFGRPYRVIWGDGFADACHKAIRDPNVREFTRVKRH